MQGGYTRNAENDVETWSQVWPRRDLHMQLTRHLYMERYRTFLVVVETVCSITQA